MSNMQWWCKEQTDINVSCIVGVWQTYVFNSDSPFSTVIQPPAHSPMQIRDLVGRDNWCVYFRHRHFMFIDVVYFWMSMPFLSPYCTRKTQSYIMLNAYDPVLSWYDQFRLEEIIKQKPTCVHTE